MDIEASKNYNNLEEESYENSIEADDNPINEEEPIQEEYITDEYDNVIIRDSYIDNNEENYTDLDEFEGKSEEVFSEKIDLEIWDEEKETAYDEGYKKGYEKGARDAMKAAFRAGFRYGIRRCRYSK